MADNVTANPGTGGATFATDDAAGVHHPYTKVEWGPNDTQTPVDTGASALPIQDGGNSITVDMTAVVPGTGANNLGKAEDSGHVSADVGVMALAVRRDTAVSSADADGDYVPLSTDDLGQLRVAPSADVTASGTIVDSGDVTLALAGHAGAAITVQSTTATGGTLLPEASYDGGTTWITLIVQEADYRTRAPNFEADVVYSYTVLNLAGATHLRVTGISGGTGSVTLVLRATATPVVPNATVTNTTPSASALGLVTREAARGQATMAASIPTVIASDQSAVPVSGPLTDTQLRATPVPVTANAGTNLNTSALALETGGNLAGAATSLAVIDDWDESDRAKVNPIVGQAGVQGASGAVSANTQRVVLATDVALPAGTNNIGDVDVLTVPAPLSTTGGGTEATALRVTVASDSTGVLSVDDNGGSITVDAPVGTPVNVQIGNATLSAGVVDETGSSAVDALAMGGGTPHDSVDSGNPIKVGLKAASALPTAVAANDRANAIGDLWGRQMVTHIDPAQQIHKAFNATTAQTGVAIWDPTSGKKIAITSVVIGTYGTTAGRVILWFGDNADTTYSAGTDQLLLAFSTAPSTSSKPGMVFCPSVPVFCTTADRELHITTDANVSIDVAVEGYEW